MCKEVNRIAFYFPIQYLVWNISNCQLYHIAENERYFYFQKQRYKYWLQYHCDTSIISGSLLGVLYSYNIILLHYRSFLISLMLSKSKTVLQQIEK